jgi:hypothetical protein
MELTVELRLLELLLLQQRQAPVLVQVPEQQQALAQAQVPEQVPQRLLRQVL